MDEQSAQPPVTPVQPPQPSALPPEAPLPDSRLNEHLKKQTVRNIVLVIAGLLLIAAIVILFGSQIIIGLSLLVKGPNTKPTVTNTADDESYIAAPVLDPIEMTATNSAQVSVSGSTTDPEQQVTLYVNGKNAGKKISHKNKEFVFRNVTLIQGENTIKARIVTDKNKQSEYSNTVKITYSTKPPELSIDSPHDGDTIKKDQSPIDITGKSTPGAKVTVNEFWAIGGEDGSYTYAYTLKDGENKIKVAATDEAGNKTEKEITIKVE